MKCLRTLTAVTAALGVMLAGVAASAQQSNVAYRYFQDDVAPTPEAAGGHEIGCDVGCTGCDTGCDSCCDPCGRGWCGLGGMLDRCCTVGEPGKLLAFECSQLEFGGWTQLGYHNRANGLFNNHPGNLNLHQQYFYLERVADGGCGCWDWGFRGDIVYGVDAQDTQAFGNPQNTPNNDARRWDNPFDHGIYGWALPQAYVEVAKDDLSIIAGKFYTIVGYETVTAPDNFFYSHAITMYNSEPFTHTGVLATYAWSDAVELYAGWTLGWDTGFDRFQQGSNWLGGAKLSITDDLSLAYVNTLGDMGRRGEGYTHSLVMEAALTQNLTYIFQNDWVSLNDINPTGNLNDITAVNNYLIYDWSDCLAFGGRLEWWKADGISMWETTAGINYKPHANLIFRPEIRYDWGSDAGANAFGLNNKTFTFGIDAILTY